MIPLLSRPGVLSLRNRISHSESPWQESARIFGIIALGLFIGSVSYSGTLSTLNTLKDHQHLYYVPPTRLLEMLLFFLFAITTLTSAVSFLGVFLLSNDLELIRSSPISPYEFFIGKFSELVGFSSWIVTFFGLPVMLAYGSFFGHPSLYYLAVFVLFPIFLILATTIGALLVLCVSVFVPAYRARDFILLFSLLVIAGGYMWFRGNPGVTGDAQAVEDIVRLSLMSSTTLMAWTPSTWFSTYFAQILSDQGLVFGAYPYLILGATGVTISLFYLMLRFGFETLYLKTSIARGSGQRDIFSVRPLQHLMRRWIRRERLGFFLKELRLFLRDLTQSIQLMLLLTLALIYLYNFQNFRGVHTLPESSQIVWQGLFSLANILMGGFILIAVSARFAYPSISLEGRAWWILQTSPLSLELILREKVFFWWAIFSLPITVIFLAGALALQLSPSLIFIHSALALSLTHLFLALGIAYSARYVTFSWEHPAQLTSNLGSFAFMMSATLLLFLLTVPILLCTALHVLAVLSPQSLSFEYWTVTILFFGLFIVWNKRYANQMIREAAESLVQHLANGKS